MLGKCQEYGDTWRLKFNTKKCTVLNAGYKLYANEKIKLKLNDLCIPIKREIVYLGLKFNESNDYKETILAKFSDVRKSYFSLHKFGIQPVGPNPYTKSKLFNAYCLPKFTYGLGIRSINANIISHLEMQQNNIIRGTLSLHKRTHMTKLKRILKIQNISDVIRKFKLITLTLLGRHTITKEIFYYFKEQKYENSFYEDIKQITVNLNGFPSLNSDLLESAPELLRKFKDTEVDIELIDDLDREIQDTLKDYSACKIKTLNNLLTYS